MKILKFGGSSVSTPQRVQSVIDILKKYNDDGEKFSVVFSAFGGVTDSLIKMSEFAGLGDVKYKKLFEEFVERHQNAVEKLLSGKIKEQSIIDLAENHKNLKSLLKGIYLVREVSPRTMDHVLSFGERNSNYIIAKALKIENVNANYLDARKIIKTDSSFNKATVNLKLTNKNIKVFFKENNAIQIVTGFIGSNDEGITTTLGRGGSDYTAAILGAALDAEMIEIWTDVNGVLTVDPRRVKNAYTISNMSYAEAMEMSHFGAKVIYPPTLLPVLKKNIPLFIKNTFNPSFRGTRITAFGEKSERAIKGLSSISDISMVTLKGSGMHGTIGTSARLFSSLSKAKINVILITQGSSENAISFAVIPECAENAKIAIEEEFVLELKKGIIDKVKVENDLSIIAVVGENMRYRPGIAGKLFQTLGKNGINVVTIAQGSSELNVSIVIAKKDESKALNALHQSFFSSEEDSLHLFIIGTGLIGKRLLRQIRRHSHISLKNHNVKITINGIANSKNMLFNKEEINLDNWQNKLSTEGKKMDINLYYERMKSMNLPNSIFVDLTANKEIPLIYKKILEASISISTPNKVACSSEYNLYKSLKKTATKKNVLFKYETNVGAGLPIITSIQDMINSGDEIYKIEAVLSGTLSFLFNNYHGKEPFAELVKRAKEMGFTEPDPREDLSGMDVMRKAVILSREIGLKTEPADVSILPLLPQSCIDAKGVDSFFIELEKEDNYFNKLWSNANKENKVLRYIASIEDGHVSIGLQAVDSSSPFYNLQGSDNMIQIHSKRYAERKLVISGPGAGDSVTAAGVFSEIINIGNYLI